LVNKFRGSVLGAIVVCAVSAFAPGTALAGTLDQQSTDTSGSGFAMFSAQSLAQTFTAGRSGGLDQVDLSLLITGSPSAPLNVEIRNAYGGTPGTTVLASHSLPASGLPTTFTFVPISFAVPAAVVAGIQYAIVAYTSTPTGSYRWANSATNSYAGGGALFSPNSPPSFWGESAEGDQAFKTYLTPPDTTPPETVIGSKKIKGNTATFTFSSSDPGSTFQCKLDKHSFRSCNSPKKYKHLSDGKHTFRVRATDASGNVDGSPSRRKFTI
jgi:hypothetical protein